MHLLVSDTIKMLIEETNILIYGYFVGAKLNLYASEQSQNRSGRANLFSA